MNVRYKLPETPSVRRRAKIVCTIGPASNNETVLRDLMRLGMDVARLNFSHGSHDDHLRTIQRIRKVSQEEAKHICIMQDLQGPKIRTGKLRGGKPVLLKGGLHLTITPREIPGNEKIISTTFRTLAREVSPGSRVLLSDGLIELRVVAVRGDDVETEIINGGMLGENKGINLPGAVVSVPSLTDKDEKDLEFGIRHGVDAIAVSFIRTSDDVRYVKHRVRDLRGDQWVIAKLEKPQAIEHLEAILDVADGVMVARGDLGVEMPPEKVPHIQKHIIQRASEWRKPVITATQMLESMIENPRPTRAEASDVANAVFDGTDAVMLSAETASGKYPREAVEMMSRIVFEAENNMRQNPQPRRRIPRKLSISETICESVAHAAQDLDINAIAVFTETGTTARLISKYRPDTDIYAFSYLHHVCNRAGLLWGVAPIYCRHHILTEEMVKGAEKALQKHNFVKVGDVMAVVAGTRTLSGSTNFMRLHVIGSEDDKSAVRRQVRERRIADRRDERRPGKDRRKAAPDKAVPVKKRAKPKTPIA